MSKTFDETFHMTTLGEALISFDPLSRGPLRHVHSFEKHVGGAELNVAVGLARLGHRSAWAGLLGDDEFGSQILNFMRGEGVDTSNARLVPEASTGIYFKEWGSMGRLRVHYYRENSAASGMSLADVDTKSLLSTSVLHLTGITPALSESCRDLVENLLIAANENNVEVSFDMNVRWTLFEGREPKEILEPLAARADILFLSDDEADHLLGGSDPDSVRAAFDDLRAKTIVVHRADGAFACEAGGISERAAYPVEVVDTVGAGDAFVAGFLSGRLRGWDAGVCLELANACGACAVSVPGDLIGLPTEDEALALVRGQKNIER